VERNEGLKQTELAEQMEMQPITLTRLIDKLCANDWIERRGDETDRRVNRLYLRKAARRCSASSPASAPNTAPRSGTNRERTACSATESIKENVRNAIQKPAGEPPQEQRYG
jgi:DNA-binding MarR family transcriptional regulator